MTDAPYDVRLVVKVERPEGHFAYLGAEFVSLSDHSLLEREALSVEVEHLTCRGVNEAGLAFTEAGVFEQEAVHGRATDSLLEGFDEMMATCASVDEAVLFVEAFGASAYAASVLLADADGQLAQLETGAMGTAIVARRGPSDPGVLVAANCFSTLEGTSEAGLSSNPESNNGCRLDRGHELASGLAESPSPEVLAGILADHENRERDPTSNPLVKNWGYSICNHGTCRRSHDQGAPLDSIPWGTVAAEILAPADRRLLFNFGWPCGAEPEHDDQFLQDRSWGHFVPFHLADDSKAGAYTTAYGELTALGVRNAMPSIHSG